MPHCSNIYILANCFACAVLTNKRMKLKWKNLFHNENMAERDFIANLSVLFIFVSYEEQ